MKGSIVEHVYHSSACYYCSYDTIQQRYTWTQGDKFFLGGRFFFGFFGSSGVRWQGFLARSLVDFGRLGLRAFVGLVSCVFFKSWLC